MTPLHRYRVAVLALGWLLLAGIVFQNGFSNVVRRSWNATASRVTAWTQRMSDAEGDLRERMGQRPRRAELASMAAVLATRESISSSGRILFGAYDGSLPTSFAGIEEFETAVGARLPIISTYTAWGDRPDQQFPSRLLQTIDRLGSVPMVTWEPWVVDFDEALRTNLPPRKEREYASLAAIARGDYDFYVVRWATDAAKYGKPFFLRFAHEMNDPYRYPWGPQNGNRPDDFIAAWKHVRAIFEKMGATNVLWVWSPHISMPWFEFYYPGDDQVDWIATGILNYGDVAPWSRWWSFHQIIEKAYPTLEQLGKPLMIAEFGSLDSGGDASEWYRQAFADIETKYPLVKSVVFFNQKSDSTISTKPLNWSVAGDIRSTQIVALAIRGANKEMEASVAKRGGEDEPAR